MLKRMVIALVAVLAFPLAAQNLLNGKTLTDRLPPDGSTEEVLFSLDNAERKSSSCREKVTLNGLWKFRPVFRDADAKSVLAPGSGWGWFKVPASFPELTQRAYGPGANNNIAYLPEALKSAARKEKIREAWYCRSVTVPESWNGRRIRLLIDLLQSVGTVYVDGRKTGTLLYPGGVLDLTDFLIPGKTHELAVFVSAKPASLSTFMGETRMYQSFRDLNNRGLCGDVELEAIPAKYGISDVHVISSVTRKTITFDTGFNALPEGEYRLKAVVSDETGPVRTFLSEPFRGTGKRFSFSADWLAPKLWDIDTPQNMYTVRLALLSPSGSVLDEYYPEEFGFREFSVSGRDFLLNGKKIHLFGASVNNTKFPAKATDEMLAHMIRVYKKFHVNFLLEAIYDFAPGTCCYNAAYWRETSRAGILTSMSMPHVKNFGFNLKKPENAAEYERIASHQLRRYQNIPGIVMLATSHNAMGYADQQNPDRIGTSASGKQGLSPYHRNRREQAQLAEQILSRIDPSRPVYHHSAGRLGSVFSINCYLNWSPIQERSDWLEKWEKQGDLPIFFVEYGAPHIASYTSERGPGFLWDGGYKDLHCEWFNEFNAPYLGERAYRSDSRKEDYYRFEEKMVRGNRKNTPLRPHIVAGYPDVHEVREMFVRRNLFDFRVRGLSGNLLWDFSNLFRKQGVSKPAVPNPGRFRNLKRSAIVNDIICIRDGGYTCDWYWPNDPYSPYQITPMGNAVIAAWRPLAAKIAGKAGDFTELSHTFRPGETVHKTLQILNDTRQPQKVRWSWRVSGMAEPVSGTVTVAVGGRAEVPVEFQLPADAGGRQTLSAEFRYADGSVEKDSFAVTVLPGTAVALRSRVGVYDPEGTASALLKRLGVEAESVKEESGLDGVQLLILGRGALAALPFDLSGRLEHGLKLLVMEQSMETLNRIGFRATEHGVRRLFPVNGNPGGIIRDWRGKATLLPQYMPPLKNFSYPVTDWNGFMNRRIWRAANRGNVATVLPEKPPVGNFLPLWQGGFDLQYAPLMEFREKGAVILFSQLDISGRTESEPMTEELFAAMLRRLDGAVVKPVRKVWYSGPEELAEQLSVLRIPAEPLDPSRITADDLLAVAPGAGLPENCSALIREGLQVAAFGMSGAELAGLVPGISTVRGTYFSDFCDLSDVPVFAGLSNSDLHFRWKQEFDAFPAGSKGGRSLEYRKLGRGGVLMMQVPPWKIDGNEYAIRSSRRRADFAMARLLTNLGAGPESGLLQMFRPENGNVRLALSGGWMGKEDPDKRGRRSGFFRPAFRPSGWRPVNVPGMFETQIPELEKYDGWFWFRRTFDVPAGMADRETTLFIGAVDDESWVWLNGKFLGEVSRKTNPKDYWKFKRRYTLKPGMLNAGGNTLVILCNDLASAGGIAGNPVLSLTKPFSLYSDTPVANDDPYRYFHW